MDNIKAFIKQNLQLILLVMCGALLLSGILVFVFGAGENEGFLKVMFILFGIALLLLGCSLLFFALTLVHDEKANYFLYSSKTKSNIALDKLDFDTVDKKMTHFMSKLVPNAARVWTENVLVGHEEIYDGNEAYKPLVAYKILYDMCERANESVWNLYLICDSTIVDSIVEQLEQNGDDELGKAFKFLHSNSSGKYERCEKFLADNKKYIQNKMLKYVKTNIAKF